MIKGIAPAAAAVGFLLLQSLLAPAQAGDSATVNALIQALRANADKTQVNPAALVSRTGTFIVKAKFTRKTAASGQLVCLASVSTFNGEVQLDVNQYIPLSNGECTLTMPYKWDHVDTGQGVMISFGLSNASCLLGGGCSSNAHLVSVDWAKTGPMPANGAKTTYDFGTLPY